MMKKQMLISHPASTHCTRHDKELFVSFKNSNFAHTGILFNSF